MTGKSGFFRAFLLLTVFLFFSTNARAASFGDNVLLVGVASGVGAILGASTLPFYSEPSEHTSNIWVGAALGAVLGVGIASFWAISSSDDMEFEEEFDPDEDFSMRLKRELDFERPVLAQTDQFIVWTPLKQFRF